MAEGDPKVVVLNKSKDCKSCVKYTAADPDALVKDLYLMRAFGTMPDAIKVTIEVA